MIVMNADDEGLPSLAAGHAAARSPCRRSVRLLGFYLVGETSHQDLWAFALPDRTPTFVSAQKCFQAQPPLKWASSRGPDTFHSAPENTRPTVDFVMELH